MTTSVTPSKTLHCSRCGAERHATELNYLGLTSTGFDDDSHAYCINVANCHSQEAEDVLDWVSHCLTADDPDDSINDLAPGDPLPEPASQIDEFGFNTEAPTPVFGTSYARRPSNSKTPELQTDPLRSNSPASQYAPDLHAVHLDPLARAALALSQAEASLAQARSAVQSAIQSAAPLIPVPELDQS